MWPAVMTNGKRAGTVAWYAELLANGLGAIPPYQTILVEGLRATFPFLPIFPSPVIVDAVSPRDL